MQPGPAQDTGAAAARQRIAFAMWLETAFTLPIQRRRLTQQGANSMNIESPRARFTTAMPTLPPRRVAGRLWLHMLAVLALAGMHYAARADVVSFAANADTFLHGGAVGHNAGGHAWFDAGQDGVGGVRRGLLSFNLATIPPGSTITSVVLQLTMTKVPAAGAVNSDFELYRLKAFWGEGTQVGNNGLPADDGEATWFAREHGESLWTTPGAADDAVASASAATAVGTTIGAIHSWSGAGLIADVQLWVNNPGTNFGWLLRSSAEGSVRSVRGFASREASSGQPMLHVGFTTGSMPNMPPSVAITNPTNGASLTNGSVLIEADASDSDGNVTQVEFFTGTTSLGVDNAAPFAITATLPAGSHSLTARATDDDGASSTSSVVTVTMNAVPITNPIAERIPKGEITIELQTVADGMASPLGLAAPDDGSGRMFVYDQSGVIWVVTPAGRLATPLLDMRARVVPNAKWDYDERGLLGTATHPNFAQHPYIYTYSSETNAGPTDFPATGTNRNHRSIIAEWRIDPANTNRVDPASRREVLRIDQPQSNHNGGTMRFGPDGFLYVALGDGGAANDVADGHSPGGNGQDTNSILGKLIRIDVDARTSPNGQYGVPSDNPFDGSNGLREIWAYGLRNPWGFSFDRMGGTLYLADVGQNRVEEIDIIVKGGNYGWSVREGTFWFNPSGGTIVTAPTRPVPPNLIDPIAQYDHDDGLAVVGGFVYRGAAIPELAGRYVFGDWGTFQTPSGRLYYLDVSNNVKEFRLGLLDRPLGEWIKGFGEGPDGELYVFTTRVVGPAGNSGRMMKIIPAPARLQAAITSVVKRGKTNDVICGWMGGQGPYAFQMKPTLNTPTWMNMAIATSATATATSDFGSGFFRVSDTAHQLPIPLSVAMSGAAERPMPLNNSATGFGLLALDGNTLTFNFRYSGLSSAPFAAHIHGPATTAGTGPILVDLAAFNGGAYGTSGGVSGKIIITDAQKAMILAGLTYVNFHTTAHSGGELRGQIAPVLMQTSLSGAAERPTAVNTGASGLGVFTLVGTQLTFNVTYRGLSGPASAAHLHGSANLMGSAGVLVDLAAYNGGGYGSSGRVAGTINLTPTQLAAVIDGQTYFNFHTTAHQAGELRGQVVPQATAVPFTALLSGLLERPTPLTNNASGTAFFSLEGDTLAFSISYSNLSGTATAAHIHGPATSSQSMGIQVDLAPYNGGAFSTSGTLAGTVVLTPAQRTMLLNGQAYVNVHTMAHQGGEIRGQIAPVLMQSYLSGASERPPVFTPATALGTFALVLNQLSFDITYGGLPTTATAAHIHGPATISQSAGVLVDLAPFNGGAYGTSGTIFGHVMLPITQLANVIDAMTYVNIHTAPNQGGEIRGHILR